MAGLIGFAAISSAALSTPPTRGLSVAPVWSAHPVGFASLSVSNRHFVAFFDAERNMTVGSRLPPDTNWVFTILPERIGWDSHNYITLTVDTGGFLHLSGNMHASPLVYFRSEQPLDPASFKRRSMTGHLEDKTTYPRFLSGPENSLIFTYRIGGSGNGDQVYNTYDPNSRQWHRLIDQPLIAGEGKKSAYLSGPITGPDGLFHLAWIWRETPDCSTSHYICYARSHDFVHWENSRGEPFALPITFEKCEVVDPVPIHGGAINGNVVLGFDLQDRPVVSYHKFDSKGFTQVYNTRLEDGSWIPHQATSWTNRWDFSGGGSIEFEVKVGAVNRSGGGKLSQSISNRKASSGTWRLDPESLKPLDRLRSNDPWPKHLRRPVSNFPGMEVHLLQDTSARQAGVSRWLRWETLGRNRDRPRIGRLPPPSMLEVYEFGQSESTVRIPPNSH